MLALDRRHLAGLAELRAIIEGRGEPRGLVVSLVGGGGKTSALFSLARSFADSGATVLASTTTRIFDPDSRTEPEGRGFGRVLALADPTSSDSIEAIRKAGPRLVLGSRREGDKLRGVATSAITSLAGLFDLVLVEADGSRALPIKAPAAHEPQVPEASGIVIGVIGLDALGAPMDGRTVHRSELFGRLVGCAPGEAISVAHIVRLAASSDGLFKGAPAGALRVVLLNKADLA
jgi:probable selenium-dependent hydroxylase accessory protein YqeC